MLNLTTENKRLDSLFTEKAFETLRIEELMSWEGGDCQIFSLRSIPDQIEENQALITRRFKCISTVEHSGDESSLMATLNGIEGNQGQFTYNDDLFFAKVESVENVSIEAEENDDDDEYSLLVTADMKIKISRCSENQTP